MNAVITISIEEALSNPEKCKEMNWLEIYTLLYEVNISEYWRKTANSFSDWLTKNSYIFNKQKAILWRAFSAGNHLIEIGNDLQASGCSMVDILPPEQLSPANIETLYKLWRVMEPTEYRTIALKTLQGTIRGNELQSLWKLYKPALEGQNARGRGSSNLNISNLSTEGMIEIKKANAIQKIKRDLNVWITTNKKEFVHFIDYFDFKHDKTNYRFDTLALVKTSDHKIIYYAFVYESDFIKNATNYKHKQFCDYFWIMLDADESIDYDSILDDCDSKYDNRVGYLNVKNDALEVLFPNFGNDNPSKEQLTQYIIERLITKK
ncbi:MAG: hypothetical protein AB7E76_13900 [Deferribacterales bacterium]